MLGFTVFPSGLSRRLAVVWPAVRAGMASARAMSEISFSVSGRLLMGLGPRMEEPEAMGVAAAFGIGLGVE